MNLERRQNAMSSKTELLNSIRSSENGLTLTELLAAHPGIARRTAQRLIAKLLESGQIAATGAGRARRYFRAAAQSA
jgi:DNA-binding IclR family transcriptional regulator